MPEVLIAEKYRPKTIDDCALPDRLLKVFNGIKDSGEIPNMILSGPAGTGKTTSAIALCNDLGVEYMVINGSMERNIDTLRTKISDFASTISFVNPDKPKCLIIDEADYLNPTSTQPALRNFMQEHSNNCAFIMTCNYPNKIMRELKSRCVEIDFNFVGDEKKETIKKFLKRVNAILSNEGVEVRDMKALASLIVHLFPDFRKVLNTLQAYYRSNGNVIDNGVLSIDVLDEDSIKKLVNIIREKNFDEAEKWSVDHANIPMNEIIENLYHELREVLQEDYRPNAVAIMAEYDYKHAFVTNQQINLLAMIVALMQLMFK